MNDINIFFDEIKKYKQVAKNAQSKIDRLEGEKQQMLLQKNELLKKLESELGISIKDIEKNISQWTKELQEGLDEIKKIVSEEDFNE